MTMIKLKPLEPIWIFSQQYSNRGDFIWYITKNMTTDETRHCFVQVGSINESCVFVYFHPRKRWRQRPGGRTRDTRILYCTVLYCTESVPRRKDGSIGKLITASGRGSSWGRSLREFLMAQPEGTPDTECWYFPVLPDSSQGTDIFQFLNVMNI